ncbi:ATP-binding protein [Streptomyces sp. Isolate_45]|uniref:ATP-binding protein n=1 Tax=Streptomyces sp. Isolate_45 TaxID=2950111 RepID=UPI002481EF7B|nr:ATP-binding protein [Streptomyces sp. Isolate_45]MDA5282959.1 ATP-binding protein [Streptomyces sp. Isolate_45]
MEGAAERVATVLSKADVAEARDAVRAVLDGLHQPAMAAEAADTVVLVVSDPHAPRMRAPDLHGGTGGFGRPVVNRLARATAVTRRASGGKTVKALLDR